MLMSGAFFIHLHFPNIVVIHLFVLLSQIYYSTLSFKNQFLSTLWTRSWEGTQPGCAKPIHPNKEITWRTGCKRVYGCQHRKESSTKMQRRKCLAFFTQAYLLQSPNRNYHDDLRHTSINPTVPIGYFRH